MKELIKITTNENGQRLVSARELHEFLESKERFSKWWNKVSNKDDYGFEEGVDYTPYQMVHPKNNQTITDYVVTVEMGKEISMISKLPKGKEARKYFIQCEKVALEITEKDRLRLKLFSKDSMEVVKAHNELIRLEVEEATKPLLDKIEEDKPLVDFSNRVANTSDLIDMGQFSKLVRDENIKLGRNKLFEWLRVNGFLMKNNEPYERYIKQEIFKLKEYTYNTPYGEKIGTKVYVTGKGQLYLIEKLRKEFCNVA